MNINRVEGTLLREALRKYWEGLQPQPKREQPVIEAAFAVGWLTGYRQAMYRCGKPKGRKKANDQSHAQA